MFRSRFTLERLLEFLARASPAIVGMEACLGSNWLARKGACLGHQVRIVSAQFVKSNKTDIVDAVAIAEAISRTTIRFNQPKTEAQLDLQALHRVRQRLVCCKTAIVNQARAFLLEYGLTFGSGPAYFVHDMPGILPDEGNGLTTAMRELLQEQWQEYRSIEARLLQLRRRIEAIAGSDDVATRLTSVPGFAHLTATAITLSRVPVPSSSPVVTLLPGEASFPVSSPLGQEHLPGITKRCNPNLGKLLIHRARACVLHLDRTKDHLAHWISQKEANTACTETRSSSHSPTSSRVLRGPSPPGKERFICGSHAHSRLQQHHSRFADVQLMTKQRTGVR